LRHAQPNYSLLPDVEKARTLLGNKKIYRQSPDPWTLGPTQVLMATRCKRAPLECLLYWGAGGKPLPTQAEASTMAFVLEHLGELASALHSTLRITCLFTDTHAYVNNIPQDSTFSYYHAVKQKFESNCLQFKVLSKQLGFGSPAELVDYSIAAIGSIDPLSLLPDTLVKTLLNNAQRCSRNPKPEESARQYVAVSLVESPLVRLEYLSTLQVTFQPPELLRLLPALPTVFMYTGKNHLLRRPWFEAKQ